MSDEDSDGSLRKKKILPQRTARGVRVSSLHGEGDDEFWMQDYWQEGESDQDYSQESEEEDVLDSDFFEDEDESDDDEVRVEKEKDGNKKNVYTDKAKVPVKKKVPPPKSVAAPAVPPAKRKRKAPMPDVSMVLPEARAPGALRSSAREATQENSNAVKQNLLAREGRPVKARPKIEHKHWTQAERLAEAARTELINRKSLEDLLRLEELNKKKAMPVRVFPTGPRLLLHDKKGRSLLGFVEASKDSSANGWPEVFKSLSLSAPSPDTCPVTHLPTHYRDPLTGIPYATAEAFRIIRDYCTPLDDEDKPLLSMKRSSSVGSCNGLSRNSSSLMMGTGNTNDNSNNITPQQNDSFPQPLSLHHPADHQLQIQLLQQQQHMQLQSSPHPQHLHPFDTQNSANGHSVGSNPHDLSAIQMQYSYAPFSQPYYKDVSYQNPNNPGLAQYHSDYQLQLQLQQLQQYPQ